MTPPPLALPVLRFAGTPRAIGEAFGAACRAETHELLARRLEDTVAYAAKRGQRVTVAGVLAMAERCLAATWAYDPEGWEEFTGIARGADLSPAQVYALQGLTDLREVMVHAAPPEGEGCSSFTVGPERSAAGHLLLGQTWDLATSNQPFVRLVHRQPSEAPATWSLTLTGCLSLIGLNAAGIAVGNTNLSTRDARVGAQYLSLIHRALRASTLDEAVAAIRTAPRAAAHYYYLADATRAVGVECSATRSVVLPLTGPSTVHCNHPLAPAIAELVDEAPGPSTRHRQERLGHLLASHPGPVGVPVLRALLADHEGGPERCICRHDHDGVSTNATVIMEPATRTLHACRGPAHLGEWLTHSLI